MLAADAIFCTDGEIATVVDMWFLLLESTYTPSLHLAEAMHLDVPHIDHVPACGAQVHVGLAQALLDDIVLLTQGQTCTCKK